MRPLTVGVAGCGPAGLAAALMLHRNGHDVRLFERFAAPRPIGSGLMIQPTGLAVLRVLGLDAAVLAAGARIDRLFGRVMPSGRTVLDVRYAALGPGFGIGIHRAALFRVLHDAVLAAGVPILTEHTVTGSDTAPEGAWLLTREHGRAGPFDLIIDALGTSSPLAPPCGRGLAYGALWASLDWPGGAFDAAALEQRYVQASRMVGVLPLGQAPGQAIRQTAFFWSLRVDRFRAWHEAGLEAWKRDAHALWPETAPLLDQIGNADQLTFARYSHRTVRRPVSAGVVQIGDAWHSASPQLGQGANMALLDAYALALALRTEPELPAALAKAVRLRRRHVWLYQAMSTLFTPAYQSNSLLLPIARDWVVGAMMDVRMMARLQAAMVSGLVGRPLRQLGLE